MQYIFDFQPWEYNVPLHLEQLGFESRNSFVTAAGVNLLHCCFVIPVVFLLIVFGLCKFKYHLFSRPFQKLSSIFFNNFYVRYNLETYFIYCVAYLLAIKEVSFYNWATSLQIVVSGIHLGFLVCLPLTVIVFATYNYASLINNKTFR
jgi:hypothetical protein